MLPLIAPPGCCHLQVGPTAPRALVEGKVLVFDDSWEHQAWAGADRMVLIVDVPRTLPSAPVATKSSSPGLGPRWLSGQAPNPEAL